MCANLQMAMAPATAHRPLPVMVSTIGFRRVNVKCLNGGWLRAVTIPIGIGGHLSRSGLLLPSDV